MYIEKWVNNVIDLHTNFMKYIIIYNIILLFICIIAKLLALSILINQLDEYIHVYNLYYSVKNNGDDIVKNSMSFLLAMQGRSGLVSSSVVQFYHRGGPRAGKIC